MRSNDGIVHGVNGCFSSGETGVGGRSWEKRALDAEEKVQRVREACEPFGPMGSIAVWRVLRALDGDA